MIYLYWNYFVPNSYGIRVGYEFVRTINKLGRRAKILCFEKEIDEIKLPSIYKGMYKNISKGNISILADDIVIYSEMVVGNPLKAKKVVRWLLNTPLFFDGGGDIDYGDTDLVLSYSNSVDSQRDQLFFIIDERLLFDRIKNSTKKIENSVSVYFGKTHMNVVRDKRREIERIVKNFDKVNIITRWFPNTREEALRVIASSDLLISFDSLTNLNYEANLLSVPTLIMDDTYELSNTSFNLRNRGTFFSFDEYSRAKSFVSNDYDSYNEYLEIQPVILKKKIDDMRNHFIRIEQDEEYYEEVRNKNKITNAYFSKGKFKRINEEKLENIQTIADVPKYMLRILDRYWLEHNIKRWLREAKVKNKAMIIEVFRLLGLIDWAVYLKKNIMHMVNK